MMNFIDALSGLIAPGQADGAAAPAPASADSGAAEWSGASDRVGPGPAAADFGYATLVSGKRGAASNLSDTSCEAAVDEQLARQYGPHLALVRAVLPNAIKHQFTAQLAAYGLSAGEEAADEGSIARLHEDVATLVQADSLDEDRAALSNSVSRFAQYVARHGAAAAAEALGVAHDPVAGASIATTPQAQPLPSRVNRRDREQPDRRREPVPQPEHDAAESLKPSEENSGYTIEDIVQFAGETIASRRFDTRSLSWPS